MKELIAIRHVAFEDLGYFEDILHRSDYRITYIEAGRDDLNYVQRRNPDLLVILGGPISVNEQQLYPFLADEFAIVAQRLQNNRPTLGICLGAQIIAKAMGAKVYAAAGKELGWSPLTLTEEGTKSPLRHLAGDKTKMFHWHSETFDLPVGATLLASTELCCNQAFAYGDNILALQFHPEVTQSNLERWYIGHTYELNATTATCINTLRQQAAEGHMLLKKQGSLFLENWLNKLNVAGEAVDNKSSLISNKN